MLAAFGGHLRPNRRCDARDVSKLELRTLSEYRFYSFLITFETEPEEMKSFLKVGIKPLYFFSIGK